MGGGGAFGVLELEVFSFAVVGTKLGEMHFKQDFGSDVHGRCRVGDLGVESFRSGSLLDASEERRGQQPLGSSKDHSATSTLPIHPPPLIHSPLCVFTILTRLWHGFRVES